MTRTRLRVVVALTVLIIPLVVGACSNDTDTDTAGPTTTLPPEEAGPPVAFVALGGDETLGAGLADGLREGWAQLLFREHLPRRSIHVNLASSGTTVARALEVQVPLALELSPTLAVVWLAGADAAQGTSVSAYERDLEEMVRQLQGEGATRVVVAVGPATGSGAGPVEPYNAVAERVVDRTGAVLADVRSVDADLGVAAQREVASAMAEAIDAPP